MSTTDTPVRGSFRGLSDVPLVARQVGFEQLSFWLARRRWPDCLL